MTGGDWFLCIFAGIGLVYTGSVIVSAGIDWWLRPMISAPEPGIYPDVPAEVYRSWEALNATTLNLFRQYAPARARHKQLHPSKPTPALLFGTAVHLALLEPDDFQEKVVERPKNQRGDARSEFDRDHLGYVILAEGEIEKVLRMRDAAYADGHARALLTFDGRSELSIVWENPLLGIPCKARLDRLLDPTHMVIDVKTAESAQLDAFGRAVDSNGYHLAAAWYLEGLTTLGFTPSWRWLVVEKEEPYLCAVYWAGVEDLADGRAECSSLASLYAECLRKDVWPGYMPATAHRPHWARKRDAYLFEPTPEPTEDW